MTRRAPVPAAPLAIVALAQSPVAAPAPYPPHRLADCGPEAAARVAARQVRLLEPPACTPASFRIPPIYERAVSALTLNLLSLTREVMTARAFTCDLDRTDVIVGVCGGFDATLRNALKVAGVRAMAGADPDRLLEAKRALQRHFGSTTHDKVGEMASIIAARIGLEIGAHGRVLAVENADATLFSAVEVAAANLLSGQTDTALVAIGQRFEGCHVVQALAEVLPENVILSEGATLLCLRRLPDAERDGDPVLGVLDGLARTQVDRAAPGGFSGGGVGRGPHICGAGMRDRFGLAHEGAEVLCDALRALPDEGEVLIEGHSLYGLHWQMRLRPPMAGQSVPSPVSFAEPVAVVGVGASYGPFVGRDAVLGAFGAGTDAIAPLSETALPRNSSYHPDKSVPLSSYAQLGSEMAARALPVTEEAKQPDAAHHLAFETGSEALAQAGMMPGDGTRWSVIVAAQLCSDAERSLSNRVHHPELSRVLGQPAQAAPDAPTPLLSGLFPGETAMRLSAAHGLNAPGLAVESACASSLAALEIGLRQLRAGHVDAVLVVASELPNNPRDLALCSAQRMLSGDRIAPFATGADGFSPGDGAGAVVLRRLADAQADGQPVLAVIRGIGGSSDAVSFTAPDPRGQVRAMLRALGDADMPSGAIGYVEAHGTGTQRGDGIEVAALTEVYGHESATPKGLGAVKSMIGHSFAAAGMAGLLRVMQALDSATLPPTILRGPLNPDIGLDPRLWQIAQEPQPWPASEGPRRAAVNALGTGGTNFHMIVEAAPNRHAAPAKDPEEA